MSILKPGTCQELAGAHICLVWQNSVDVCLKNKMQSKTSNMSLPTSDSFCLIQTHIPFTNANVPDAVLQQSQVGPTSQITN